ncbi:hypothetical protein R1sor_011530 [Riccia sorocarpa]|uniref:HIT domain-containing protein n=1 Tax=Riccia sorocarpa TaxID=122646 RepID=A0ABD3I4L8_9MARC
MDMEVMEFQKSNMGFEVWKELSRGKFHFASGALCEAFLVDDALYPGWLVLVPQRENATELFHLSPEDQITLMQEVTLSSRAAQKAFGPDKINVGALGNEVAQLHIHVVPRFRTDKAWPWPVWGAISPLKFSADELWSTFARLKNFFKDLSEESSFNFQDLVDEEQPENQDG